MGTNPFGGGQSGNLPPGRSGRGEPPNLSAYSDEPQYDLATVVQLIGVRPLTLWAWEQQLNVPRPERVGDGTGGTVRHYSDRDLAACTWLRDQILAGFSPADAAARLMAAQPSGTDTPPAGGPNTGGPSLPGARPPVRSGPLNPQAGRGVSGGPRSSGPLSGGPRSSGPLAGGPRISGPLSGGPRTSGPPGGGPGISGSASGGPSRPLNWGAPGNPSGPLRSPTISGPLRLGSGANWPAIAGPQLPAVGGPSGSLPPAPGAPPVGGARGGHGSSGQWTAVPTGTGRELRSLVPQLIRAFGAFDTFMANRLVEEALAVRSVEHVCMGLLLPAVTRVGEMWSRHELSIPEERYAINFVRARLFAIFAGTPERYDGPLAVVACGPRELHDLGALMLATFWRRAGLRVAFLGQDVEGQGLVQDVRRRRPQLVCVSIMTSQRVRALARIAKDIVRMNAPTPIFTFSGAVFAHNPELKSRVSGVYLGDDPASATWHAMRLLGMDHNGQPQGGTASSAVGEVS